MTEKETSGRKEKELKLPVSRVKLIMKCSPGVGSVGQDAVYLVSKAAELFIQLLTRAAYEIGGFGKTVDYDHIAEVVQTTDELNFVREIMPRKIKYGDYLRLTKDRRRMSRRRDEAVKSNTFILRKSESMEHQRSRLLNHKTMGDYYGMLGI